MKHTPPGTGYLSQQAPGHGPPICPVATGKSEACTTAVAVCLSRGLLGWAQSAVAARSVAAMGTLELFFLSLLSQVSGYLSQSGAR